MEAPQGNSLCSYHKQSKPSFFFFFFSYTKEQESKTGPAWRGWYQWEGVRGGEMVKKGKCGANTVYTCM
jgi:hypothetical protein